MFEKRFNDLISRLDTTKQEQFKALYNSATNLQRLELIGILETYFNIPTKNIKL